MRSLYHFIKNTIHRFFDIIFNQLARFYVYHIEHRIAYYQKLRYQKEILSQIRDKGENIKINGKIFMNRPMMVTLGSNVHIGSGAYFFSDGGLVIGDNAHLSRNVTIYTSNHNYEGLRLPYDESRIQKPVFIGENVWIGINVCITPGVTIGEGAIIGMGAVITKDVAPYTIVGNAPQRVLKSRDVTHYHMLKEKNALGGASGVAYHDDKNMKSPLDMGDKVFFIVGTGRSGSQSITKILSQHPDVDCQHEPKGQLIRLSTEYAHGTKTRDQVKEELIKIYRPKTISKKWYGESDQKLSNLIPILHEIFPQARFVGLIRNPRKVVVSTYSRGWFDDREYGFAYRPEVCVESIYSPKLYSDQRLNGAKVGEFTEEEWREMTPFSRNCWYWRYWNELIIQHFNTVLPQDQKMVVALEELNDNMAELLAFLNITSTSLNVIKSHKAQYVLDQKWNDQREVAFQKYCVDGVKFYPVSN